MINQSNYGENTGQAVPSPFPTTAGVSPLQCKHGHAHHVQLLFKRD
jgi:hypothetical protein